MRVALVEPQAPLRDHLARLLTDGGITVVNDVADADAVVVFADAPISGWAEHVAAMLQAAHGAIVLTHVGATPPMLDASEPMAVLHRPFDPRALIDLLGRVELRPAPTSQVADAAYETVELHISDQGPGFDIVTRAFATSAANLLDVWSTLEHASRVDAIAEFLQRYRAAAAERGGPTP